MPIVKLLREAGILLIGMLFVIACANTPTKDTADEGSDAYASFEENEGEAEENTDGSDLLNEVEPAGDSEERAEASLLEDDQDEYAELAVEAEEGSVDSEEKAPLEVASNTVETDQTKEEEAFLVDGDTSNTPPTSGVSEAISAPAAAAPLVKPQKVEKATSPKPHAKKSASERADANQLTPSIASPVAPATVAELKTDLEKSALPEGEKAFMKAQEEAQSLANPNSPAEFFLEYWYLFALAISIGGIGYLFIRNVIRKNDDSQLL